MRKNWITFLLVAIFGVTLGCRNTGPDLQPPPGPEEFTLPPPGDKRYSEFVQYPGDTLFQPPPSKTANNNAGFQPGVGPRPGSGFGSR